MGFGSGTLLGTAAPGLASTCYMTDCFPAPVQTRTTPTSLKRSAPPPPSAAIMLPSRTTQLAPSGIF